MKSVEIPCQLWIVLFKLYYCADRFRFATNHVCKKKPGMGENYFLQVMLYLGTAIEKGFWLSELEVSVIFCFIFMIIHLHKPWVGLNFPHCPWTEKWASHGKCFGPQLSSVCFQLLATRFFSNGCLFVPRQRGSTDQGGGCSELSNGGSAQESRFWKIILVAAAWGVLEKSFVQKQKSLAWVVTWYSSTRFNH